MIDANPILLLRPRILIRYLANTTFLFFIYTSFTTVHIGIIRRGYLPRADIEIFQTFSKEKKARTRVHILKHIKYTVQNFNDAKLCRKIKKIETIITCERGECVCVFIFADRVNKNKQKQKSLKVLTTWQYNTQIIIYIRPILLTLTKEKQNFDARIVVKNEPYQGSGEGCVPQKIKCKLTHGLQPPPISWPRGRMSIMGEGEMDGTYGTTRTKRNC
eukprot:GEMP01010647.1.p1 GENE.GEMP01010647.1~~GEMP01010647.1.p1  ORF type:complete len:217 (+),score=-11.13 GEMP01010647.1:1693-2343(+)